MMRPSGIGVPARHPRTHADVQLDVLTSATLPMCYIHADKSSGIEIRLINYLKLLHNLVGAPGLEPGTR